MRIICNNGLVYDSNDYLSHHGIMGMHWGKQNGPPYPLGISDHSSSENKAGWINSLSAKQRKKIEKDFNKINKARQRGKQEQYTKQDISSGEAVNEKLLKEHTVQKGTTIYRVSTNSNEKLDGPTYVTYLENDRNLYRGGWVRNHLGSDQANEYSYTLQQDIKVPSRQELYRTIDECIKDDKGALRDGIAARLRVMYPKDSDVMKMLIKDTVYHEAVIQNALKTYEHMNINQAAFYAAESFGENKKLKDAVIDKLKKQGYNAIRDEASVGGQNKAQAFGEDPLILFDSSVLKRNSVKKISESEEKLSSESFMKWQRTRDKQIQARNTMVTALSSRGWSYRQIAEYLGISPSTVADVLN